MNRSIAAALASMFFLPFARPALAHGFGQSYNLPVPLWLYLYGAAAAVVLSCIPLAMFASEGGAPVARTVTPASTCFASGSCGRC